MKLMNYAYFNLEGKVTKTAKKNKTKQVTGD